MLLRAFKIRVQLKEIRNKLLTFNINHLEIEKIN